MSVSPPLVVRVDELPFQFFKKFQERSFVLVGVRYATHKINSLLLFLKEYSRVSNKRHAGNKRHGEYITLHKGFTT